LALLFVVAAGMIGHSLRYRSQAVTGFAYLLAYLTIAISHVTLYSLGALAILTLSMGVILWKLNWFAMELLGLAGAYACHLSWVAPLLGATGQLPRADFFTSAAWLTVYWLTFNFVHLARTPSRPAQTQTAEFSVVANAFLFLGLMRYQARLSGLGFWALLGAGVLYVLFAYAAQRLARRRSFVLFLTIGIGLLFAAVPLRYTGARLGGLWLIEAQILLLAGFLLRETQFSPPRLAGFGGHRLLSGHSRLAPGGRRRPSARKQRSPVRSRRGSRLWLRLLAGSSLRLPLRSRRATGLSVLFLSGRPFPDPHLVAGLLVLLRPATASFRRPLAWP